HNLPIHAKPTAPSAHRRLHPVAVRTDKNLSYCLYLKFPTHPNHHAFIGLPYRTILRENITNCIYSIYRHCK
ncbi:MAG: hypothetical protein E6899_11855, partial [Neisseria sp.]|nr:hypothetical protein [Neisseria sp.]